LIYDWLRLNGIELLGTITGLLYIYYSTRQNILLWFFGIINAILLILVYYFAGLYAIMYLQLYYIFVSIYGWIHWRKGSAGEKSELPVTMITQIQAIVLFICGVVLTVLIAFLLNRFTDSTIPVMDGFTTAFSIVATWMLARKILEHWLIWIIVDLLCTGIYIFKHLYLMMILFAVYTVLAIYGYYSWKKSIPLKQ
jgi:nicotinamide mononucleotide transporter